MESNGPLHGPARHLGCLVFPKDPLAADSACCSLMDIYPCGIRPPRQPRPQPMGPPRGIHCRAASSLLASVAYVARTCGDLADTPST